MTTTAQSQNHSDDKLVAVGESLVPFINDPSKAIEADPNVQLLEDVLLQVIRKLAPTLSNDIGFVNSDDVTPNSTWLGARELCFSGFIVDNDPKPRKWTIVVRYKNIKPKGSQEYQAKNIKPFYVDMKADATTSARCATSSRAHFVCILRNEVFGMSESTWQIKPNDSLLSHATKEIAKVEVRVGRLEQHVFGDCSSSNEWQRVSADFDADKQSIPSTDDSVKQQPSTALYLCCCAGGKNHSNYRSHPGKKCKDGSYDMRTICNRGHCKQCGGSETAAVASARPKGILHQCCLDAVNFGRYQQHEGPRCKDSSYDMRYSANQGRCKLCGVVQQSEPLTKSCALASPGLTKFTQPARSSMNGVYDCCCKEGGSEHPLYRSHGGKTCLDGSYDMRCKENKSRCKRCGGNL